jgi:hypothetical protein
MWDCYGLEYLCNLTEWSEKATYDTLMEKSVSPGPPINALLLRARFNPQRNYEIYTFNTDELDYEHIKVAFEASPQGMADWIRKNGQQMYSARMTDKDKRVIE